VVLNQV